MARCGRARGERLHAAQPQTKLEKYFFDGGAAVAARYVPRVTEIGVAPVIRKPDLATPEP